MIWWKTRAWWPLNNLFQVHKVEVMWSSIWSSSVYGRQRDQPSLVVLFPLARLLENRLLIFTGQRSCFLHNFWKSMSPSENYFWFVFDFGMSPIHRQPNWSLPLRNKRTPNHSCKVRELIYNGETTFFLYNKTTRPAWHFTKTDKTNDVVIIHFGCFSLNTIPPIFDKRLIDTVSRLSFEEFLIALDLKKFRTFSTRQTTTFKCERESRHN